MFSLPRDTVDVPLPPGPRANVFGGVYRGKINSLWTAEPRPSRPVPRHPGAARLQRPQGHARQPVRPRDQLLRRGQLRRLQAGRRHARRGHDQRPDAGHGRLATRATTGDLHRIYIPAGIQHMTGAEALVYARSRHALGRLRPRRSASSACCCRCASRRTSSRLVPKFPDLVQGAQERGPHRHPDQPAAEAAAARGRASTRRTSGRTCSRRRSTRREYLQRRPAAAT